MSGDLTPEKPGASEDVNQHDDDIEDEEASRRR
jgi:hypothetical protein